MEEEFESVSEEMEGVGGPDMGRTECFFFLRLFLMFFFWREGGGGGEGEAPLRQQGTLVAER